MAGNTVKDMTTNFGKLDKFEGHHFRRWQKKMHFLLTALKVVYVLTTPMPELLEDETMEAIRIMAKWENDDYIYRGHILNGMSDSLFDVYTNVESAKELWDSLESKYMAEDSSIYKNYGPRETALFYLLLHFLFPSWIIELDQGGLTSVVIYDNSNDPLLELPEFESFQFDLDPSFTRPPPEPPDVEISLIIETDALVINNFDELNEDECFDPGGGEINVEVDNSFTFVTCIFLPYLTNPEVSPLLSFARNEDTIFDPGIFT
ncbi:hypothetical protein Tco_0558484 [Tanacetum coccineum]